MVNNQIGSKSKREKENQHQQMTHGGTLKTVEENYFKNLPGKATARQDHHPQTDTIY
jgi:hypothetical protein